jgi:hypothetical protein
MLGSDKKIKFKQKKDKLILHVPAERPTSYAAVFEVKGAL